MNDFPTKDPVTYGMEGVAQGKVIGHYTQLVWGSSTKIGCGFMAYVDTSDWAKDFKYRQVRVESSQSCKACLCYVLYD